MNYKTMKGSMAAFVAGMGLWYGAGLSGYETTPGRVVEDASRIGVLESIVQDSGDTRILGWQARCLLMQA